MSYLDEFISAIRSAGYEPPSEIIPGKFYRFSANGKRSDTAGFCKMFEDMRGGIFGDFRTGDEIVWQAEKPETMTAEQKRAHRQAVDAARKERELEQERLKEEARQRAEAIWSSAEPANDDHPYIIRKGVHAFGVRLHKGLVVVPMRDPQGNLTSLQFISDAGEKRFLTGGQKRGCYATIGKPGERIYIAEGYATAATIHEAIGEAVVIAFDAGNIDPVAKAMREKFRDIEIIIAADNDRHTDGNPGLTKAKQAAREIGARVIYPEFDTEEGSDFNDYAAIYGLDAVSEILKPTAVQSIQEPANENLHAPVETATVDFFSPLPDAPKGKPLSTIENLEEIIRRLGVVVRYNVIKKDDEIIIPGSRFSIDNQANASLAWLTSWVSRFKMPTGQIGQYVTYLADQNLYNPAAQYVMSRPWDGVSRVQAFYNTITAKGGDQRLKEALMRRWMISAIAAAFRPDGVSAHGVLVLQGDQDLGKTHWFKSLVPDETRLAQDGWTLRPDDKDNVKQACSFWLVELGELDATFRKSDIAALKSFLTRDRDVLRRPYAQRESEFARRTVFFASVNPREFLHDPTGNRRYWTIECAHIDHTHGIDMQQVWAEFLELYRSGESWFLQGEEKSLLNESNKEFEVRDPIEDRIMTKIDWQAPGVEWSWKTVTDILLAIGLDRPDRVQLNTAGIIIRRINGGKEKKSNGKKLLLTPPIYSKTSDGPF